MKLGIVLITALLAFPAYADSGFNWDKALNGEQRSENARARDKYRHPKATLEFFGLKPGMTVVEIAPGGGWYTEVIAPLMQGNGSYYAAHHSLNSPGAYYRNSLGKYLQKLAAHPDVYSSVVVTELHPPSAMEIAPAGTADMVLAFRNFHSWMRAGSVEPTLKAISTALKPGGLFGIVQHRAKIGTSEEQMKKTGYVAEAHLIDTVRDAGFELTARSNVNANEADSTMHPNGVWSLPPAYRGGDVDKEKYQQIGESDRMTLLFTKTGQ